jgi:hypothetical protein
MMFIITAQQDSVQKNQRWLQNNKKLLRYRDILKISHVYFQNIAVLTFAYNLFVCHYIVNLIAAMHSRDAQECKAYVVCSMTSKLSSHLRNIACIFSKYRMYIFKISQS